MADFHTGIAAAVTPIPGNLASGIRRLDVTGTAATFASLPGGFYIVRLTSGCADGVLLRHGATAAEPASGSAADGAVCKDGETYHHNVSANTDLSAIALNGGSGRLYLCALP